MRQRICFIGDSQIAALKLGWDKLRARYPDFGLDMFASPGTSLQNVVLKGGKLRGGSPMVEKYFDWLGGSREIDIGLYSRFYLCTVDFSLSWCARPYVRHGYLGLNSRRQFLVSRDCFNLAAAGILARSSALRIARMLRTATRAPITIIVAPKPSELCLADPNWRGRCSDAVESGDLEALELLFDRISLPLLREVAAVGVKQPDATVAKNGLTRAEYSAGSVRLSTTMSEHHPPTDYVHMNERYGTELLAGMLPAVA
jgi:hypothetical protein